ncbi:hypothetical protein [Streptomyces collinus]|uniref:hypothetical protein n=1 Tax=Streptomyces collinus TaxID=42684 RepID=UPI0036E3FC23
MKSDHTAAAVTVTVQPAQVRDRVAALVAHQLADLAQSKDEHSPNRWTSAAE